MSIQNLELAWCLYSQKSKHHFTGKWAQPCRRIFDDENSIEYLQSCDVIIYQHIKPETSQNFCSEKIKSYNSNTCRLISVSSVYFESKSSESSLKELKKREDENSITIRVSEIIEKFLNIQPEKELMLTCCHPTTFLFLEILKILCEKLPLPYFPDVFKYQSPNYIGLPR